MRDVVERQIQRYEGTDSFTLDILGARKII